MSSKSYFYNKHPSRSKSYYGKKRIYGSAYQPGQTTKYQRYGRTMRLDPSYIDIPRSLPTRQSQLRQVEELRKAGLIPSEELSPVIKYYNLRIPSNNTANLNDLLKSGLNGVIDFNKVLGINITAKFRSQDSAKYLYVGVAVDEGLGWVIKSTDTGSNPILEGIVDMTYKVKWDGSDFNQQSVAGSIALAKALNDSYPNKIRIYTTGGGGYFFDDLNNLNAVGTDWGNLVRETANCNNNISGKVGFYMARGTINESLTDWSLNNWTDKSNVYVIRSSEDSTYTWQGTNLSLDIKVIYY